MVTFSVLSETLNGVFVAIGCQAECSALRQKRTLFL
jgi:hypothetical protein